MDRGVTITRQHGQAAGACFGAGRRPGPGGHACSHGFWITRPHRGSLMSNTTRAAVIRAPGQPWEIAEVTYDDPRAHEVVVRLRAAGLCHSDDHLRSGDTPMRYPMVGGHEGAGIVVAVGPGVERLTVGDRVVSTFLPVCGVCPSCAGGMQNLCDRGLHAGTGQMADGTFRLHLGDAELGGFCALGTFADRMVVSEYSLIKLADDVDYEVGALLGCAVPTGWGSAVRAARVNPGDTVVVLGAGGVGLNAVQGAALAGALRVVVVDPNPFKRESAMGFGATHTFDSPADASSFLSSATRGRMADHCIVTVGVLAAEHINDAVDIVGKRGQVVLISVGPITERAIQLNAMVLEAFEKVVRGSIFGSCQPLADVPLLMDLYRTGRLKIDELITRRYSLEQVNEGYADLLGGRNLRGVITFSDS
jgi:alcohol dehydrogenase (nicotinoprotein)